MTDRAGAPTDSARIGYRLGDSPDDRHGLFDLMLAADGTVVLRRRRRGVERTWAARADAALWPRLIEALRGAGFPAVAEGTGGGSETGVVRDLMVEGADLAGAVRLRAGDVPAAGLADAVRLLDSLVHLISGIPLPGPVSAPVLVPVHGFADGARTEPPPEPSASVGVLAPRRVAGVVRADGGVSVIGVPAGTPVAELVPKPSPRDPTAEATPRAVAFGDTGRPHRPQPVVLTGGDDGMIRLWTAQGAPMAHQVRHTAPITAVTTSVDEGKLQVWSADLDGRMLQRSLLPGVMVLGWPPVPGSRAGITALGWAGSPSYQVLVIGLDDGRVVRRAVRSPNNVKTWRAHDGPVHALALIGADDDFLVASGGADRVIRVRAGHAGTAWPDLAGHDATVTGLSFGLIGERLVLGSCSLDGTAATWNPETGEVLARWPIGDGWPAGIAVAGAGADSGGAETRWVTGGADGVVRVWQAAGGARVHELHPDDAAAAAVTCLTTAMLPGLTVIAAGHADGAFRLWNAADGTPIGVDRSSTEALTSVEFGRDGRLVAFVCGTPAGSVRVYDPVTAELARVLTPHTDRVRSVAFGHLGPDREPVIVSGGDDRTVRVWGGRTGWPLLHLTGHTDEVTVLATGEVRGRTAVASGGPDGTVRLWDVAAGVAMGQPWDTGSAVHAVSFGPAGDGVIIATGGRDGTVRAMRPETGEVVLVTDPAPGVIAGVAVGAWHGVDVVAAACADGVRCWTLPGGEPVPTAGPPWPPLAVTFGAGGELLAVGVEGVVVIDRPGADGRG